MTADDVSEPGGDGLESAPGPSESAEVPAPESAPTPSESAEVPAPEGAARAVRERRGSGPRYRARPGLVESVRR